MERMTGGEAIVRALIEQGVDTVFGLPGAQTYTVFDALRRNDGAIRTVTSRHEQGAAYMAFGYAQSTGKLGVFSVVPGPGVLNAAAAMNTAWGACAPVLCVTGQIPSAFIGKGRGALHEMPDQLATLQSFLKRAWRIESVADAPRIVQMAWREAQSCRPGPVSVEMAMDLAFSEADVAPPRAVSLPEPPALEPAAIEAAAAIIAKARRPMIMVGGGAQHASAEVTRLAELLGAPVASFRRGRGVVADDHPLGANAAAAFRLWEETDVLIGIGSRLGMQYDRWAKSPGYVRRPPAPPRLIRVDIDAEEMDRLQPEVGIVGDAALAADALALALAGKAVRDPEAVGRIAEAKRAARAAFSREVQPQVAYLDVIRACLPRNGIFVEEVSQVGFASNYAFPVYAPRSYVTPGFTGTLGFGFQTALGVKAGNPDKAVVSISGDGGLMFGVNELITAVEEKIGVVAIVFNNGGFGNVRRDQRERFGGRTLGSELMTPDFVMMAKACGMAGARVASPEALRPVLEAALHRGAPMLIEVMVERGSEASPWPFIMPHGYGR